MFVCFFNLQTYICANECSFTVNTLEQMFMRDLSLLEKMSKKRLM